MYCVKCGVELADSERKCPLCKTPVYFPGLPENPERPFPEFTKSNEEISPRGMLFIISIFFAMAAIITAVCDINLNDGFTWSVYVAGALVLSYVILILPGWFRRPSPAIFVPVSFLTVALYVLAISLVLGEDWFLPFALPVIAGAALIVCPVSILCYYLRMGYLYIFGGMFIALGVYSVFIEIMIHLNFGVHDKLVWSIYLFVALFLIGIMLIVIAIVRPFRESLRRIFSI